MTLSFYRVSAINCLRIIYKAQKTQKKLGGFIMQSKIREAALGLGNIDAQPVTGHPFDVWHNQLNKLPIGKYLSFEHDPVKISDWPLEEATR